MFFQKLTFGIASSVLVTAVACGGTDPSDSNFNNGNGNKEGDKESVRSDGTFGGTNEKKPSSNGDDTATPDLKACATQTATAEARPVYLVFMFDKSGSMTEYGSPKWDSSKAATKAFFASPNSKGVSASLTFFPDQGIGSCKANAYDTPLVAMAALPNTSFAQKLDDQNPGGGTPTYAALKGAISYAEKIAKGPGKDGKVAVVLVTDGLPSNHCERNSVADVQSLAASVATTIPTYVVGVGDALTNLNDIAAGGGTTKALIVNTTNAAQIQADFTKAINSIKTSTVSCDYAIPAAPSGVAFDRAKVNVQHVPEGGAAATLAYNQDCTGGAGWKYDDATNPTRIVLCDNSCDGVKSQTGKVDILFGCATQTADVK